MNDDLKQCRDAIQAAICDPGSVHLCENTMALLQVSRGPAFESSYEVVQKGSVKALVDEINRLIAQVDQLRVENVELRSIVDELMV